MNVEDVLAYLGSSDRDTAQVAKHLEVVTAFVRAYTRGNGFTGDSPDPEIGAVILTVTARLLESPTGIVQAVTTGPFTQANYRWDGFNLLERAVLHRYRKRTA